MRCACLLLIVITTTECAAARDSADQDLATYIDTLQAIDSHAHPMAFVAPGAPADSDFDALPLDGIPPFELPPPLRASDPAYRDARRSFYGTSGDDSGSAAAKQRHGDQFPNWVLDQLHIRTMLANRVAMGAGLTPPRFRWVAFADPLMLPLDIRGEAGRTPDTKPLYPLEAQLLKRYLRDVSLTKVPATLAQYQHDVVQATLERQHTAGAVAIKFEAAYLRALDFDPADSVQAAAIYRRYAAGGVPTRAEYKLLEDHLVRFIAREAGRLGMAVQIHSLDQFGGHYSATGAAPHLLGSMFSDSSLRGTHFVIVHGGWPLVGETLSQLERPNVYTDISMMDQLADSAALSRALRPWLAAWPEKVMFGTDAFDGGVQQGWELVAWVASHNARRALSGALTGMVHDHEITAVRAKQLARMILRENAIATYRLGNE